MRHAAVDDVDHVARAEALEQAGGDGRALARPADRGDRPVGGDAGGQRVDVVVGDVDRVARMTVPELHERWAADPTSVQILDVREQTEWDAGRIPGSVHVPYHDIDALPAGIDADRPVAAICGSGQRSAVAASLLKRFGAGDVIHVVDGGVPQWQRKGWPIEAPGA